MSPHFCPGFAPELWFICTVAAPRIPALILASSGLCKAVATQFLQRAPVLPPSYDVAIETNMALRPPRGHFTDPARQWCSAFTQRFLKAAVTWWKRRSWKVTFGYRRMLCLRYRPERFLWIECGLRPESLYESGGERRDHKLIKKKTAKEGWDVLGAMLNMPEWAEGEKVNRSRASRSLPGCISLGIDLGCVTERSPRTFVMAHNRKCFWHRRGLSTLRCRQVKRSVKNCCSMLVCFPLLQWRRADQKKWGVKRG